MKLISCDNCGVVLDQDKLNFSNDIWRLDKYGSEEIDPNKADYNQVTKTYEAFIPCPVCKEKIYDNL